MASGTSTYRRGGRGGGGGGVDGGGSSGRRRDCHYATVRRSQAHKYSTFSIAKWFRWYRRGYHEKEEEDKLWFHDNLKRLQAAYAAQEQDYDDGATDDVSVTRSVGLAATWSKKFSGSTTTVNSFSYMGGWRDDADNGRTRSTEPNAGLVTFARRRNKRAAPAPPSTVNSTPVNTLKATIPNTPKATATVTPKATPAGTPAATPTATLGAQVKCVGTMRKKNRAPPPPVRAIRFDDEQRPPPQQQQQRKYRSLSQLRGKGPAPKPPVRSSPDCDRLEHQLNRIERHVSSDKSGVNGGRQSLTYEPAAVQFAKMAATNMTELDKRAADICRLNKLRETMYVHDEPANTLPWPTELHYYTSNVTEIGISSASLEVTRASVAPHKSVVVAVLRNAVKSVARNDPTDAKPAVMLDPSVQGSKSEAQGLKPEAYGSKPEAQDLKPEAHALKPKAQVSKPEVRDRDSLLSPKPTPRTSLMIEIEKKVPMPAPQTMSAAETCKTVVTSTAKNDQLLIRHKRLEFFELRQRGKTTFENRNGNVKATKLSLGTQTASSVVLTKPATLDHDCDTKSPRTKGGNNCYQRLIAMEMQSDLVLYDGQFECAVCLCTYDSEGVVLRDCLHVFCRPCLQMTINHSKAEQVKCPYINEQYSCTGVLQHREIKKILDSDEEYERFLQKSVDRARQLLAKGRNGGSFQCRRADCTGWCLIDDMYGVFEFKCPVCGTVTCVRCGSIHVPGKGCRIPKENNEGDGDDGTLYTLESLIERGDAMPCPGCGTVLSKQQGCDWIKCAVCSMEICWATKGPRWGPKGKGDITAGCMCGIPAGRKCHINCKYCH